MTPIEEVKPIKSKEVVGAQLKRLKKQKLKVNKNEDIEDNE